MHINDLINKLVIFFYGISNTGTGVSLVLCNKKKPFFYKISNIMGSYKNVFDFCKRHGYLCTTMNSVCQLF